MILRAYSRNESLTESHASKRTQHRKTPLGSNILHRQPFKRRGCAGYYYPLPAGRRLMFIPLPCAQSLYTLYLLFSSIRIVRASSYITTKMMDDLRRWSSTASAYFPFLCFCLSFLLLLLRDDAGTETVHFRPTWCFYNRLTLTTCISLPQLQCWRYRLEIHQHHYDRNDGHQH